MKKIVNPWIGVEGYFCFGCSPDNPKGLKMEFYEDGEDIIALWSPSEYSQGWVKTLHGGIQCTLMDEIAAWVIARRLQTTGVTSKLNARFLKSISTDEVQLTVKARLLERKRNAVFLKAEIFDSQGDICADAEMVYFIVPPEKAAGEFFFRGCRTEDEI